MFLFLGLVMMQLFFLLRQVFSPSKSGLIKKSNNLLIKWLREPREKWLAVYIMGAL